MATTSLKLPDELKQRAIVAAERIGISPHAFMVDAIEQASAAAEMRAAFIEDAHDALAQVRETGAVYDAAAVHKYIRARAAGKKSRRPVPTSWHD
jgi:predicted transcriptional regulator